MTVAAAAVASGQGFVQALDQWAFVRVAEGFGHGVQHLWADQAIALHGELFAAQRAGPGQALVAGPAQAVTLSVNQRALAQFHARIGGFEALQDFLSRQSLTQ